MIARFFIKLPFVITVPDGEIFNVYQFEKHGYLFKIFPPLKSSEIVEKEGEEFFIDGKKSFLADALKIDVIKNDFDRRDEAELDPPISTVQEITNDFIARLRYVTKAIHAKPMEKISFSWRASYLNDDESELVAEEGKRRGYGAISVEHQWLAVEKNIWDDIFQLPPDWEPPIWSTLILDAYSLLPEIGPSISLAFTSLEVFAGVTLDALAGKGDTSDSLWKWINNRKMKNPKIDEQYDHLMKELLGFSLKENNGLWENFTKLRQARNSFAHNGVAVIDGKIVDIDKARALIQSTNEIIQFIKEKLPEDMVWPEYDHKIKLEFSKLIIQEKNKEEGGGGA